MLQSRCKQSTMPFIVLLLVGAAAAVERNATALAPGLFLVGPVVEAQFPPNIKYMDTVFAVRYGFLGAVSHYNIFAVCDPRRTALTFFGEAVRLPEDVCASPDTFPELYAYSYIRLAEKEFQEPGMNYARLMIDNGYDPEDRSTDASTAIGMGNILGSKLAEWMGQDGWNSRGDLSRSQFRKPFEDYTGYTPVNTAHELKYPLRWQPLVDANARFGRFTVQKHVAPFLGYVKPLLMTTEEFVSRYTEAPYSNMNATALSGEDAQILDALVREVVQISANSTPKERALAEWFENKLYSLGSFGAGYLATLKFDGAQVARWYLGEAIAQYDSVLLAWKEKRRIDAVRPRSIIRNFYADEDFPAFVNKEVGVTFVKGKDWEPVVATQAHSEYPSASAAVCTVFAEHASMFLKDYMEATGLSELPEITLPTLGIVKDFSEFTFKSPDEARQVCGESRVWAGVHFTPAVAAGEKLVEGIGLKAYQVAKDLFEGRVPSACSWCTQ